MYQVMYKCRFCQQIYPGVSMKSEVGEAAINAVLMLTGSESTGSFLPNLSLTRLMPHRCYDGVMGMGDVIGLRYIPDPPANQPPSGTTENSEHISENGGVNNEVTDNFAESDNGTNPEAI